jgi:hypothetical protein
VAHSDGLVTLETHPRSDYRPVQAARIFGETRTGSRIGFGSFDFHAAHAAAAAARASMAT